MEFKKFIKKDALKGKTTTENGDITYKSSNDQVLDFFYKVGSMRGQDPYPSFLSALQENEDLAIRSLLHLRDVHEGAGERDLFRTILTQLSIYNPSLAARVAARIPALGRFDDLLPLIDTPVESEVISVISSALRSGSSLCAKWMPRTRNLSKKIRAQSDPKIASALRFKQATHNRFVHELARKLGYSKTEYRKLVSKLSTTVEQHMCAKSFSSINYNHVPSRAAKIYTQAFLRQDNERYQSYLNALTEGTDGAKINASAIYPYDVLGNISQYQFFKELPTSEQQRINAQWKALPNYLTTSANILPIVDVSGSMFSGSAKVTPIQVAVSLGLYISSKQKGPFKDVVMTFDSNPTLVALTEAPIVNMVKQLLQIPWGMSTDLDKAFNYLLSFATKNEIPASDMPEYLLIVSDMQFNSCKGFDKVAYKRLKSAYKSAGYELPTVIFWNVSTKGGIPLKSDTPNTALISGFSTSILKSIFDTPESLTPLSMMLTTLQKNRYNY